MKTLKKFLSLLIAIAVLFNSVLFVISASPEKIYLSIDGKTIITDNTEISDIKEIYGTEKLKTNSIFGGNAYTFYEENYSNFLYVETNTEGKITCYSTFGNNFTSSAGNSGEKESGYISRLCGDTYSDYDGIIWGVTGYCPGNISDYNTPSNKYENDSYYANAIAQHASIMWNAVSAFFGNKTGVAFDSRTFYTNRQLIDGKSNLYEYCNNTGKSEQFRLISLSYSNMLLDYKAIYPNPGMYAQYARNYTIPSDAYPVFDYDESSGMIIGSLMSSFFSEQKDIPYTDEEKELLSKVRKTYMESVDTYNSSEKYFEISPQDEILPLEPGIISLNTQLGAIGYINSIRVGAGLPELEYSKELAEGCQYKAVLTSYLSKNNISNPSPHFPPQPDGISNEFYKKAQTGSGENLYHGNVITSITNALNDAYGDYITCGHRYNLLSPYYKYIGLGSTEVAGQLSFGIQGVHKFSGYQNSNAEIVAWPSKGIMISQAGAGSNTMYTAQFYKNYSLTENTGVIFKCLNTGETFTFTSDMDNTSSKGLYINGDLVSYFDKNISMIVGNVYEITITNVLDKNTNTVTNYSYRSVYETAYEEDSDFPSQLYLSNKSLSLVLGETYKINAVVSPENSKNKMVKWSSDLPEIASVNENGYVTAKSKGTATITAKTDNGIIVTCTVTVAGHPFIDLVNEWYIPYIEKAYKNKLMNGTSSNTFEPDTIMTRAMFVTLLANLEGISADNSVQTSFSDVYPGNYYTGAVNWASQNGLVKGISKTEFEPNSPITREQMCTLLIRYCEYKNIKLPEISDKINFEDEFLISEYAKSSIDICQKAGLISGMTETLFEPQGKATRAQAAKIFSLFYEYI